MPRYSYKAYDRDGARTQGELAAATREGALETLVRRGQFPLELTEGGAGGELPWWQREVFGSGRLPLPTLSLFTRELTSLVKADLPIDEALRLVAMQPMLPMRLRQTVKSILARVVEGEALSDALAAEGKTFPEFYWRLVRAGEASGSLGDVLEDLAGFLDRSAETRGRVASALLYPAVLILAALIAIGVIVTVLLPTITPLFKEAGAEPPLLIKWLGGAEEALRGHWTAVLGVIAALVIGAIAAFQSRPFRLAFDAMLLRLPLIGTLIERRESGRLARTLATLLRNGVPMIDAVRIGGSVLSNGAMSAAVRRAGDEIKEGGVLSSSLTRSGLFSDLFLRLTVVGEETGQLDTMLQRVAAIYESALDRQVQRLTSLITPVVTLLIGGVVGGLILTVMSALISVNDLALR